MENALTIAKIIGPLHIILGLSVMIYPSAWQKLGQAWKENHFSLFGIGIIQLVGGLIIVNLYNDWYATPWLIVTILGWIMILKALFYFLLPGAVTKWGLELMKSKIILFSGGVLILGLGVILSYYSYVYPFV